MSGSAAANGPRVALVSVTMGLAQRGYERLFRDMFEVLRSDIDLTLLKGGEVTSTPREYMPRLMPVCRTFCRLLPLGQVAGSEYRHYKADCLAFAASLLPALVTGRFDIVHLIDFPLGHMMRRARPLFGQRTLLLMTNACRMKPQHYPAADCIQEIALPDFEEALAEGADVRSTRLLPIGIHVDHFQQGSSREHLRSQYGIADDTFVILSVAAIKRVHKRVDYIISEVAGLQGDFLLWLDGSPEDKQLAEEAQQVLGPRCRITLVPTANVRDLYRLADVMVHGALEEAFGLSIVEGLSTGLQVLTHDSAHFHWLTGSEEGLINMREEGSLRARLQLLLNRPAATGMRSVARRDEMRGRFDWQVLRPHYLQLYNDLCAERAR